jgi:hypothetical protein
MLQSGDSTIHSAAAARFRMGLVLRVGWAVYLRNFLRFSGVTLASLLPLALSALAFHGTSMQIVASGLYWLVFALSIALTSMAARVLYIMTDQSLRGEVSMRGAAYAQLRYLKEGEQARELVALFD